MTDLKSTSMASRAPLDELLKEALQGLLDIARQESWCDYAECGCNASKAMLKAEAALALPQTEGHDK